MDHAADAGKQAEGSNAFEGRDHIVVGIGRDELGPYWSALGEILAPITLESAVKSREWHREQHPDWDVRIYRLEEVK
jgi:hypothetical protein